MPLPSHADRVGCKDHPAISRYAGARLDECKTAEFDEYRLLVKLVTAQRHDDAKKTADNSLSLQGRITRLGYEAPKDRSPLELYSNIQAALKSSGAEVLFQCSNEACSPRNGASLTAAVLGRGADDNRYIAARLPRPEGDIYLAALVIQGRLPPARIHYDILEVRAMQAGQVTVDAAALQTALSQQGRQALYGIEFDSNAATLKPESQPQLDEIVKLLKAQSSLSVYVVGHTDNVGALEVNLELSQRRAQAVVAALVRSGIAANRLVPRGIAQLSPVASNAAEAGRAKNRRVEIVQR